MRQTNYLKLFSIFAFLVFGGVSCWATAESLHLLLATWPKIFCYLVAIGFFVVAAIGTKLIVDSLNQKIYVEGRTGKLIAGIFLVLIFWLATSMPTNTHTFIYRNVISERVNNDIVTTLGYLSDIVSNSKEKAKQTEEMKKEQAKVRNFQEQLVNEVLQPDDLGSGVRAKKIIEQFKSQCGYNISESRTIVRNQSDANRVAEYYNSQFDKIINTYIPEKYNIYSKIDSLAINAKSDLEKLRKDISVSSVFGKPKINLNSSEDMHDKVIKSINNGYQAVKLNSDRVNFNNNDKKKYTADPIVTDTQRMTSIFEVWGDYMAGKFNGHGFFWWILLAVLIDIAAFIFFDIAFKKTEY